MRAQYSGKIINVSSMGGAYEKTVLKVAEGMKQQWQYDEQAPGSR